MSIKDRLKKITGSVFTKIILILLITGLAIHLVLGGFFMRTFRGIFHKNAAQYIQYLIKDMGLPPDPEKAWEISRKTGIDIRYESADLDWTTSAELPPLDKLRLKNVPGEPHVRFGRHFGRRVLVVNVGKSDRVFVFGWSMKRDHDAVFGHLFFLLMVLAIFLTLTYFLLRRILRPVKELTHGVRRVSAGDIGYRVPVGKPDELGELAGAFNAMTGRIKNMLNEKEQLLLDVSHELRSPLTRMKVALEFLPEGKIRTGMREDIGDMEKMVTEILETARLDNTHGRLNLVRIDLGILIREVVEVICQEAVIRINPLPEPLFVTVDPARIKMLLNNLLTNALKYSGEKPVRISHKEDPSYIVLQITDEGTGIPPSDLPHIFEPFYRVDKSRSRNTGGYGLGLSLCKKIMTVHKGKIEIESQVGKGTIVSLYFFKG